MELANVGMHALILLVEDDTRAARRLAQMLREDGWDVELAVDGAAAIGRLARGPVPDVLVTDFELPHANGLAVMRYARSRRADLPIFLLTGYPERTDVLSEFEPAAKVFTKPFKYDELVAALALLPPVATSAESEPPKGA